jgi:hypothetical protein
LGSYRSLIINLGAARGIFKIIPAILNFPGLEAGRFYRVLEEIVAIVSLSPEMGRKKPRLAEANRGRSACIAAGIRDYFTMR